MNAEVYVVGGFCLVIAGLIGLAIWLVVGGRRRRRAWERLGDDLGWKTRWSGKKSGNHRLRLAGQHRDRAVFLSVPLGGSSTSLKSLVVGSCAIPKTAPPFESVKLVCRRPHWSGERVMKGFWGIVGAIFSLIDLFSKDPHRAGDHDDGQWDDPSDADAIDISDLPLGEHAAAYGSPREAVLTLLSDPRLEAPLLAFMGPKRTWSARLLSSGPPGQVRVKLHAGKLDVASNKLLSPDQWEIPANLLVEMAEAVDAASLASPDP